MKNHTFPFKNASLELIAINLLEMLSRKMLPELEN